MRAGFVQALQKGACKPPPAGAHGCGAEPSPGEVGRNLSTDFSGLRVQVPSDWLEVTHRLFLSDNFSFLRFPKTPAKRRTSQDFICFAKAGLRVALFTTSQGWLWK